jgi:D-arabinose 1-dehydrogenase-like Zn-dependent alcohol dehydrogenase
LINPYVLFAAKMVIKTVAVARGKDKEQLVRKLGAIQYIDHQSQNPVEELVKLGGVKIFLRRSQTEKQ